MESTITLFEVDTDPDAFQYFLLDDDGNEAWRWSYGGDRHFVSDGRPWNDWAPAAGVLVSAGLHG